MLICSTQWVTLQLFSVFIVWFHSFFPLNIICLQFHSFSPNKAKVSLKSCIFSVIGEPVLPVRLSNFLLHYLKMVTLKGNIIGTTLRKIQISYLVSTGHRYLNQEKDSKIKCWETSEHAARIDEILAHGCLNVSYLPLRGKKVYCPVLPLVYSWVNYHIIRMCLVHDVSQHKPLWDAACAALLDGFRKCPWQCLAVYGQDMALNRLPEGPDWLRTLQGPAALQVSPYQCSGSTYKTSQRQSYWLDSRTRECSSRALFGSLWQGSPPEVIGGLPVDMQPCLILAALLIWSGELTNSANFAAYI